MSIRPVVAAGQRLRAVIGKEVEGESVFREVELVDLRKTKKLVKFKRSLGILHTKHRVCVPAKSVASTPSVSGQLQSGRILLLYSSSRGQIHMGWVQLTVQLVRIRVSGHIGGKDPGKRLGYRFQKVVSDE